MTKKIAILQSNYIPWKGYFDLIAAVDEFIVLDDVQYTRRDWRNRNKIKTPRGLQWLTVPVRVKGRYLQKIQETQIFKEDWKAVHWKAISHNYRRAAFYEDVATWLSPLYQDRSYTHLSELNRIFIEAICSYLGIRTMIRNSWDYEFTDGKTNRLVELCAQAGGTEYISGPTAVAYIKEDLFHERDIKLTWFDYSGYPEYRQLWGEYTHNVSVLDLLFNCGDQAPLYMKHV